MASGLLDTSALLLLSRVTDPASLPDEPLISAITLAELAVGALITDDPTEQGARLAQVQQAEADFEPVPFDAPAARAFGRVAASLRRSGRKNAPRSYDAMIAAVAIANDLPLYTANPEDFLGIDELTVIPVALT